MYDYIESFFWHFLNFEDTMKLISFRCRLGDFTPNVNVESRLKEKKYKKIFFNKTLIVFLYFY